jgi:hypothetical protein
VNTDIYVLLDVMPCSLKEFTDVSDDHAASSLPIQVRRKFRVSREIIVLGPDDLLMAPTRESVNRSKWI